MRKDQILTNRMYGTVASILVIPKVQSDFHRLFEYDKSTATHSLDVALNAVYLGYINALSEKEIQTLGIGSLLHDIGKIFVPL